MNSVNGNHAENRMFDYSKLVEEEDDGTWLVIALSLVMFGCILWIVFF